MATHIHEAQSDCRGPAFRGAETSPSARAKLAPGDTLVVSSVGCLGESYAEISEALRDLMRRRILVRADRENLIFDGAAVDSASQASRDALIAFAAAAAETEKTARGALKKKALLESGAPTEAKSSTALQLGVVGVQLGALALAAYLFSQATRDPAPPPRAEIAADEEIRRQEKPAELQPYTAKEFVIVPEPRTSASGEWANALEKSAAPLAPIGATRDEALPRVAPTFGLSRARELEIFSVVGEWRSARVKDASFPIAIGAAVPPGVRLATFPRQLAKSEPALRAYKFIVADRRIAVVDPVGRQIVTILNGPA